MNFPGGTCGKEPACQCRRCKRHRFSPWVGKIPYRRTQQPTQVVLPGRSHGHESGRLQSIGSQRVGHDRSNSAQHIHLYLHKACTTKEKKIRRKI